MDFNRLTEKVQEGLRAAQSKAVQHGNQQIDVEHLLSALLEQEGGLALSLFLKAELPAEAIHRRLEAEIEKLPKVSGPSGGPDQIYVTSRLQPAADPGRGRSQEPQGRVRLGRAPAARHDRRLGRSRPHPQGVRRHARAPDAGAAGGARQPARHLAEPGSHLRGAGAVRARPDQAGRAGQARSGDRPRRGDPPRHPGAVAAHQEQPGADRRAGRRQDGHRRRAGAAHRPRRRARRAEEQDASSRSTWAR